MSKKSDEFEKKIENSVSIGDTLPVRDFLPEWLIDLGVIPGAQVVSVKRIGSKSKDNKTDVLIKFNEGSSMKISAKLSSADFFGNWYGHIRFLNEFGEEAFKKLTKNITEWANNWIKHENSSPFIGVSICFGKRSGNTAVPFLDIFTPNDIISVVQGYGDITLDKNANCMYISDTPPESLHDLIQNLRPINLQSVKEATGKFMIAYRPINPATEVSNRGKNVYTQYVPFKKLDVKTTISSKDDLIKYGSFQVVSPTKLNSKNEPKPSCLNHNHIIKKLSTEYNIIIPVKQKTK